MIVAQDMPLVSQVESYLEPRFATEAFMNAVEDHLTFFRQNKNATVATVNTHDAYLFVGDFYGLLRKMSIERRLFWTVMRMNGLACSQAYDGKLLELVIPYLNR